MGLWGEGAGMGGGNGNGEWRRSVGGVGMEMENGEEAAAIYIDIAGFRGHVYVCVQQRHWKSTRTTKFIRDKPSVLMKEYDGFNKV